MSNLIYHNHWLNPKVSTKFNVNTGTCDIVYSPKCGYGLATGGELLCCIIFRKQKVDGFGQDLLCGYINGWACPKI